MKKLFMHIGLGKTGSSALQSWLSLNSEALSKQGVDYADLVPQAKLGEVSSGNGYALHKACVSQDFEEVERLLTTTYFFNPKNHVALISCELFQGLRPPLLQKFHDTLVKCSIDVTIIAYVRSAYEQIYSTYLQGIKRASIAHPFGEGNWDVGISRPNEFLKKYVKVFGDRVLVVNYDEAKQDIYASLAGIIGVEKKRLKKLEKKVNRSLTLEEAEVLRRMNGLHGGVFATSISDFVVKMSPDVETPVFYDPSLVRKVRDATQENLRWVNEHFKIANPVASDHYDGYSRTESVTLARESYEPVIQWAMNFDSGPTRRREFAAFLRDLVVFMLDISVDDAIALKEKLQRVQFELEQESEQLHLREDEKKATNDKPRNAAKINPAVTSVSKLQPKPNQQQQIPKHLITYFFATKKMETEAAAALDSKFHDWCAVLEKHAVGSTLNPIKNTHLLRGNDMVSIGKKSAMTGYTLVRLADTEAVLALARKCPLLEVGGVLEVSRIVNLLDEVQESAHSGKDRH